MSYIRKNLRWIIPLFIVLVLIIFLFCYYNLKPRIKYKYDETKKAYIVETVYGDLKEYTIPAKYNDKKVYAIGSRAFYNHKSLEKINFEAPENVTKIDRLAFGYCENLKTIDLTGVTEISRNAFSYCYMLDNIETDAKYIGGSCFYKCTSLKNIRLKEGVESIGTYAFSYTIFEEMTLPKTVKNVYVDAFLYQASIKKLYYYAGLDSDYVSSLSYAIPLTSLV